MSDTSASGSGGAAAPGWYTDPHDPRQLRWWSGEAWTEHVSPGSGAPQAAQAASQVATPAANQAETQAETQASAGDQPLPSRRALRDPATDASEAAAAALAAQAAQQQAAEQLAAQQLAAQELAVQQQGAQEQAQLEAQQAQAAQQAQQIEPGQLHSSAPTPAAVEQPSAPVPTLPVAPTSFLEQQGYTPLSGSAPVAPVSAGWGQPSAEQPPVTEPPVTEPPVAQPAAPQHDAWNQPAQPAQPAELVQPVQPIQPASPVQPNAWNQPVQPEQHSSGEPSAPSGGIDSLFGGTPADPVAPQTQQGSQWGLTPTDSESRSSAREDPVSGSSSFWAWLIALSPILAAGAVAYVMLTTKTTVTEWPFAAALAAPYLLVLLFALADRYVLLQLGHTQPRSAAWALLSAPIYLIARAGETRRADGSGTTLTVVWFVSVIVAIGGIVGYGLLTHHALIAGLPT